MRRAGDGPADGNGLLACGDGSWYEAVINSCEDAVKAKLSIHAIKMVDDMMETKDALDQEKKVCITFECCFV